MVSAHLDMCINRQDFGLRKHPHFVVEETSSIERLTGFDRSDPVLHISIFDYLCISEILPYQEQGMNVAWRQILQIEQLYKLEQNNLGGMRPCKSFENNMVCSSGNQSHVSGAWQRRLKKMCCFQVLSCFGIIDWVGRFASTFLSRCNAWNNETPHTTELLKCQTCWKNS